MLIMTPYIFTTILATVINIFLGLFVLFRNPSRGLNRTYFSLSLCLSIWGSSSLAFSLITDKETIILFAHIFYLGMIFLPSTYLHFTVLATKLYSKNKRVLIIIAYSSSFLLQIFNWTGLLFKDVIYYEFGQFYFPRAGGVYPYYLLNFFFFMGYGTYILWKRFITTKNPVLKTRMKYMILGACIAVGGGLTNFALVLGFELYPVGYLTVIYCMCLVAYAMFKYRLMDIDIILRKGFVYTTLTAALTTILVSTIILFEKILKYTTGYEAFMGTVISIGIVTIIFQPLREKIQLVVDKRFFRERFDQQEFLKKVGKMLTTTIDKDVLLPPILRMIVETMHIDGVSIMLLDEQQGVFNREFEIGKVGQRTKLKLTHPVVKWFETEKRELLKEEILETNESLQRSELLAQLKNLGATLSLPLFYKDELLGILNLGNKFAGKPYDKEDLTFLSSLISEISVALENTKLFTELKRKVVALEKLTYELKEANEAKSTFLTIVSHELRTPLTVIMGYITLFGNKAFGEITKEQERSINIILDKCKHLNELISDILDLSWIEQGRKYKIKRQSVDFKKIVEDIILIFTKKAQEKQIILHQEIDPNLPVVVYDKGYAEEILKKLVDNAIKFTPKNSNGKVTIKIKDTGKYIEGCVEDTGIGIKRENFDKIFERFIQLDMSDTRVYEGIGLGLAIVKEILKISNGTIKVESEVGKGSRFTFTIPKEVAKEEELHKIKPKPKKPPQQTQILIVDDDEDVLRLLELYMTTNGYKINIAKDGVEALEKLYVEKPNLIIFNLRSTKVDGYEIAHILRDHEETKDIPLIMLVPLEDEDNLEKIYKAGATLCLFRPFDFTNLMEKVRELV